LPATLQITAQDRRPAIVVDLSAKGAGIAFEPGSDEPKIGSQVVLEVAGQSLAGSVRWAPVESDLFRGRRTGIEFVDALGQERLRGLERVAFAEDPLEWEIHEPTPEAFIEAVLGKYGGDCRPFVNIVERIAKAGANRLIDLPDAHADAIFDGFAHRHHSSPPWDNRLHFLKDVEGEKKRYFGYVTLRPLRLQERGVALGRVGHTLIVCPEFTADAHGSGNGQLLIGKARVPCYLLQARHGAHVFGRVHDIWSMQFGQQSVVEGTCGHAAMSMSTGFLSRTYMTQSLRDRDIREFVTGNRVERLSDYDIVKNLATVGLRGRVYATPEKLRRSDGLLYARPVSPTRLADMLHFAVDSYLPAILTMRSNRDLHALVAAGHTGSGSADKRYEKKCMEGVLTTTAWVEHILVHDDAKGPYLPLPLWGPAAESAYDNRCAVVDVQTLIVPTPEDVVLDPLDVHSLALQQFQDEVQRTAGGDPVLDRLRDDLRAENKPVVLDRLREALRSNQVVIGAFLDQANRFRTAMIRMIKSQDSKSVEARILRSLMLPRYLYVATITCRDGIGDGGALGSSIDGYALIDATATRYAEKSVLLMRLGELFLYTDPRTGRTHEVYERYPERRSPGMSPSHR